MSDNLPAAAGGGYELLKSSAEEIQEVMGALRGVTPMDLDRVRIPPGGGTFWEVPGPNGATPAANLRGIVLGTKSGRIYWRGEFGQNGGQPPDCVSDDAEAGRGTRWEGDSEGLHACAGCRLSKFGSDGRGQACKQIELVLMVTPGSMVPLILSLPPTSLRLAKQYTLRLAGARLKLQAVETEWTLRKTQNRDGIGYAQAVPRMVRKLEPKELDGLAAIASGIKEVFSRSRVQEDAYDPEEEAPKS